MPHHLPEVPEPQSFDYTTLNTKTKIFVQEKTTEIKRLIRRSAQDIIDIGQKLIEVKEKLGHGSFRRWLKTEFTWSIPAANKFMQVAQKFKSINFIHLDIAASALYLLAAPSTPEEARLEALERASQGEVITHALAKQIRFHHTIDVEAEVVKDEEDSPAPVQPPPVPKPQSQAEPVNEPLSSTTELEVQPEIPTDVTPRPAELDQAPGKLKSLAQTEPAPATDFKVGDRVRILHRQHGEDNWAGETARIWQITPDGWLRVDVEGHKGVRFTLNPDWVERMEEETPEQQDEQSEQALIESQADVDELENDPEASVEPSVASKQSQDKQQTNLERRARVTLTLKGEQVKVEGIITHVHLKWQHGDLTEDMQVPIGEVEFVD